MYNYTFGSMQQIAEMFHVRWASSRRTAFHAPWRSTDYERMSDACEKHKVIIAFDEIPSIMNSSNAKVQKRNTGLFDICTACDICSIPLPCIGQIWMTVVISANNVGVSQAVASRQAVTCCCQSINQFLERTCANIKRLFHWNHISLGAYFRYCVLDITSTLR